MMGKTKLTSSFLRGCLILRSSVSKKNVCNDFVVVFSLFIWLLLSVHFPKRVNTFQYKLVYEYIQNRKNTNTFQKQLGNKNVFGEKLTSFPKMTVTNSKDPRAFIKGILCRHAAEAGRTNLFISL